MPTRAWGRRRKRGRGRGGARGGGRGRGGERWWLIEGVAEEGRAAVEASRPVRRCVAEEGGGRGAHVGVGVDELSERRVEGEALDAAALETDD
eukprot:scaffold15240_cov36-Phaeocystis_antarctica.AAC.3